MSESTTSASAPPSEVGGHVAWACKVQLSSLEYMRTIGHNLRIRLSDRCYQILEGHVYHFFSTKELCCLAESGLPGTYIVLPQRSGTFYTSLHS
jgi:hypothetical protein